ncbi:MAG: hypothetical protein AAF456_26065 [Planctomycetota bacterium]
MKPSSDEAQSRALSTDRLLPGDRVRVLSCREILATLDEDASLDGLPFMPEMSELCGRILRIARIANKNCVRTSDGTFVGSMADGYVLQTGKRCDGSYHGGCQLACNFIWKRRWLSRVEDCELKDCGFNDQEFAATACDSNGLQLLTTGASGAESRFRCQATELVQISSRLSPLHIGQYFEDYRSGIGPLPIAKGLFRSVGRRLSGKKAGLIGPCDRTPVDNLSLKVGEAVRVKSLEEIRRTLDKAGCNRGLWFDPEEMEQYCGKRLVVSRVIHRLIDETTGELRQLKVPCVVLAETECSGIFRRFCSRGMLNFWREVWLTRCK